MAVQLQGFCFHVQGKEKVRLTVRSRSLEFTGVVFDHQPKGKTDNIRVHFDHDGTVAPFAEVSATKPEHRKQFTMQENDFCTFYTKKPGVVWIYCQVESDVGAEVWRPLIEREAFDECP